MTKQFDMLIYTTKLLDISRTYTWTINKLTYWDQNNKLTWEWTITNLDNNKLEDKENYTTI